MKDGTYPPKRDISSVLGNFKIVMDILFRIVDLSVNGIRYLLQEQLDL